MGIKTRKFKRKARNITLITITVIAFALEIIMPLLWGFHEAKIIYEVLWLLGFAWLMCFIIANEKREDDVY